ncbi:MAG: 3-phosphoglycerate dehydrogenase [Deltaproteobacteria bacterium CG11_big_fil_rev_8_21_14_0_20_47_16]|nr:MAG: 3-phosphoglycerate dehydrogenase [Deltaproteobacteria bacterium CG11_big_fil_rev_8_21_14_0_20_47_16]
MKILICDGLDSEAVKQLENDGHDITLKKGISPDELNQLIADTECVVVRSATKIKAPALEHAKNLKLVVRAGVGLDNVDAVAAQAKGITVQNTPTATTISVAEHAFGLMLALARHIPQGNQSTKEGKWERKTLEGTELYKKTIGILGFGRIGQEVAKRAKAFHMRVIACDRHLDPEMVEALEIESGDLDTLLNEADYLSLHLPLDDSTRNLFNADRLGKMKKGARIINTARGGLIDEQALADAIKSGQIGGAAIDVFAKEPTEKDNPLFNLPQCICVPHLGASTAEGQLRAGAEVARIIREFNA